MLRHSLGDTDLLAAILARLQAICSCEAARWLENEDHDKI